LVFDEVTEYANALEDILAQAQPSFDEIKRLADRSGITYHFPTTSDNGIHDLVREATRSPRLLDRMLAQLPRVLPHIDARIVEQLDAARPVSLRASQGGTPVKKFGPGSQHAESTASRLPTQSQNIDAQRSKAEVASVHRSAETDAPHEALTSSEPQASRVRRERRGEAIRAAWISGWFLIVAAIVGAVLTALFTNGFGLFHKSDAPRSNVTTKVIFHD